MLFTPGQIGTLELPNRLIRSATAEKMADEEGFPLPTLHELYTELTRGGVGLIISGHLYIAPNGKCHPEMTAIDRDQMVPALAELVQRVHDQGGKVAAQINHGGGNCAQEVVSQTIAPSPVNNGLFKQPPQEIGEKEIESLIQAFGAAAARAQKAGFDTVQIHAAHGYLISQFLSPLSNRREDKWGGNLKNRSRFLYRVCQAVRESVGSEYPVLIKFGMEDGDPQGLSREEGGEVISRLASWGIDGLEISVGFSGDHLRSIAKGIRRPADEAYLLPLVKHARESTDLPLIAVGGYRSRKVMEQVLLGGWADFISLSRPLISEPDLPRRFREDLQEKSRCISANNCWPEEKGEGIACKCPLDDQSDQDEGSS